MILGENQPIQNLPDGWFCYFSYRFFMILAFGWCYHVIMKSMKIFVLHRFFNDFGENPAAVSNQPGARQATSGPRERATKREPFVYGFREKFRKTYNDHLKKKK